MSDAPVKQKTPAKRIVGTVPSTSDGLQFTLAPNADSVCPMTLTNRCNKAVAFKIKTNNTERYLVQPNQGVISTNGTAEIQIFCLARNVNEILQTSFHQMAEYQGSDKFLLQTRTIDASKMEELMKKAGTVDDMAQVAEELSQLFATTAENKRKIQHHKFQVGYDSDFWKQPVASPPANAVASVETIQEATIPVNQAEDPAKDSGEENVLHGNLAAGGGEATPEQASGNEMVRKEDAMNSPSLPEDTKVSASLSADNTKGSAGTTMRVSYDSDKMEKDLTALRKKYDELLKWTLKLTGDRDQLQKMTDKLTQENTKLRLIADTKRNEVLKPVMESMTKNGSGEDEGIDAKKQNDALADKFKKEEKKVSTGFSLFQVLLVAVFAFAVGRILDMMANNQKAMAR